ncbi:segment polarity protein dishevelled homolog DVL-3 [Sarcophilus harrisii]|uniref:segment polarity protein dishevelled homolog DVL-3 n=1 Tax=Sarcophilus harrisii TaxID=9305 RepID=UPI001301A8D4|nr:segment polarity protein dishevelled homolog DVL-3 [Sarcophilus harrisii]
MGETKIIYHLDGQETPYLVKLPLPAERVTLADFKGVLQRPTYKFFFKSMDDDFGVVKEEISDDNARLPCFNGRVVSWVRSPSPARPSPGARLLPLLSSIWGQAAPLSQELPKFPLQLERPLLLGGSASAGVRGLPPGWGLPKPLVPWVRAPLTRPLDLLCLTGGPKGLTPPTPSARQSLGSAPHGPGAAPPPLPVSGREGPRQGTPATGSLFPPRSLCPHSPHTGGGSQENLDNDTETDSLVPAAGGAEDGPEHASPAPPPPRPHGRGPQPFPTSPSGGPAPLTVGPPLPHSGPDSAQPRGGGKKRLPGNSSLSNELDHHLDSGGYSTSRFSSSTEQSSASRLMRRHKRRRRKQKVARIERSSSFSSITDSTMSLNIITVTLNMEKYNFLGISIVGQSNERGDGGIYIGSIMKGGAVAADGRIEPGDMLLQVNDINFENMSNDDAVRVLREIVHKPGPITLTVAKCWDPSPRGCFTLPRSEPIRPIDPAAWVSHTAAMTGTFPAYGMSPSLSTITSTSSSIASSIPDTERLDDFHLSIHSDMATIVKAMASPESGLEVRDRMWLKITIPNAFIGKLGSQRRRWAEAGGGPSQGFTDPVRKRPANRESAFPHVNKITFSEVHNRDLGISFADMANLSLHDQDGSSGASDQDTLAPLPHPGAAPWPMAFPYQYPPPPHPYNPHPGFPEPGYSYAGGGSAGSQHSEGSRSSGSNRSGSDRRKEKDPKAGDSKSGGSGSESDHTSRSSLRRERAPSERSGPAASEHSVRSHHSLAHSLRSHHTHQSYGPPGVPPLYGPPMLMMPPPPAAMGPPGAPPGRDLASVPPELTASRQSFRMAMGNPSEFFVDVM